MSSQDFGETWATQRDSSVKSFFSSISDIDSLLIGANDDNKRSYEWYLTGAVYSVEVYGTPFTEPQAKAEIAKTYLSFPSGVSYIRTGDRTFQFDIQPPIGNLTASYLWTFPGGGTSNSQSQLWTAPSGEFDPFEAGIPARVTVTATISSPGLHHGFTQTTRFFIAPADATGQRDYFQTWVFTNGEDGFKCYRLPVIIRAGNGDLLALAEGRPDFCSDFHQGLSVVMKRSADNGATWGRLQVIAENIVPSTGQHLVAQNVTAVLDKTDLDYPAGKIVIVYNATEYAALEVMRGHGVRRVITAWSGDHGHTWRRDPVSSPEGTNPGDITGQVAPTNNPAYTAVYDTKYAAANYNQDLESAFGLTMPTLGHSIQLERGNAVTNGRLFFSGAYFVPARTLRLATHNYVFWSDDHGTSWTIGGRIPSTYNLNESIGVELEDGRVLINSRGYLKDKLVGRVLVRVSFDADGNASFGESWLATDLLGVPAVAAGMARVTTEDQTVFGSKNRIAFSTPQGPRRNNMAFWMSTDEGERWNAYGSSPKRLNSGHAGYSDTIGLPDTRLGVLYEGVHRPLRGVRFASTSLHWMSGGNDQRALVRHDASGTVFDGSSSGFVDLSSLVGEVEDITEGSVVVTFKTDGVAGGQTLFSVSDSGDADSMWSLVQTGDGRFGVYARNDSTDVNLTYFDRDLVTDGLWHRMAVTVGADGTHIYVDGEHVAGGESTGFFADVDGLDAMDLGRVVISGGAAGFWDGSIGTLEVFDGVLTAEQAVAATQPAAMPVAAFHVDQDLTTDQAISMATAPGGTDLVADHLPQWECNELAASWAIGTTFTAPDSVTDQATVFQSEDSVTTSEGNASTASLMLGIWGPDGGERIGLRYDSPVASEWDLSVPFDAYSGQKVSMIAVMGPVNSYLIINGQTVATTPTPVPEGPHTWHPANTTIGTTNTDHALGTNLKTLAIWKGVVPSTPVAQSLTLAHNITR